MKTKNYIDILLENGMHFKTVSSMKPNQIKLLAERFFKFSKVTKIYDDELKDDVKDFIVKYSKIANIDEKIDDLEDEKLINMLKDYSDKKEHSKYNEKASKLYKEILKGKKKETKEAQTYNTQTTIYDLKNKIDREAFDAEVNTKEPKQITATDTGDVAVNTRNEGVESSGREINEKFESRAQQGLFWAKCINSKGKKKKKWCDLAKEFSSETSKKDYENMPYRKETSEMYEKNLKEAIIDLIEKNIEPSMTKGDFIKLIQEKKGKSEDFILRPPFKKNNLFQIDSDVKKMDKPIGKIFSLKGEVDEETEEKEKVRTRPGIKTPKRRRNPHKDPAPGVKENPKAENPKAEDQKNDFMSVITSILNN